MPEAKMGKCRQIDLLSPSCFLSCFLSCPFTFGKHLVPDGASSRAIQPTELTGLRQTADLSRSAGHTTSPMYRILTAAASGIYLTPGVKRPGALHSR